MSKSWRHVVGRRTKSREIAALAHTDTTIDRWPRASGQDRPSGAVPLQCTLVRRSLRQKAVVVAAILGAGLLSAGCGGTTERPISPMPSVSALVLPSATGPVLDRD